MLKAIKFFKDLFLFVPVSLVFQPIARYLAFIYYYNLLVRWIYKNKKGITLNDFYSPFRDYHKRSNLYQYILDQYHLSQQQVLYMEFGVASGVSFRWWLQNNQHPSSAFFGFDTFEGLPEDWGVYRKGDMSSQIPQIDDQRGHFIKGLFQDTFLGFVEQNIEQLKSPTQKVIHLDADLYTATAFVLSQLYPYLRKGDLILFDEFNVAMHEFKAFHEFTTNFQVNLQPVAAVNNFYQTAFVVA